MKKIALLVVSAILLTSCASAGNTKLKNITIEQVKQHIVEGKTTKEEVEKLYGSPDSASFTENGNEIWTYRYREATSHVSNFIPVVSIFSTGQTVKTKEIIVLFNQNNVVQRFTMRNSDSVERAGIFGK